MALIPDDGIITDPAPSPKAVLLGLVNDTESVASTYRWAHNIHDFFPAGCSTLVLCRFLFLAGIPVPYSPSPERQVDILAEFGWKPLPPTIEPAGGDIYIAVRSDKRIERLGFVAKWEARPGGDRFSAADNVMPNHRPYRRSRDTVANWMGFG